MYVAISTAAVPNEEIPLVSFDKNLKEKLVRVFLVLFHLTFNITAWFSVLWMYANQSSFEIDAFLISIGSIEIILHFGSSLFNALNFDQLAKNDYVNSRLPANGLSVASSMFTVAFMAYAASIWKKPYSYFFQVITFIYGSLSIFILVSFAGYFMYRYFAVTNIDKN